MSDPTFDRLRSTANAARRPREQAGEQLIRKADPTAGATFGSAVGITNDFAIGKRALDEFTRDRGEHDPDLQPGRF